ncbi:2-oxoacid:ferredoxin oxidoreductase subunit beta [Candidatus Shapirobacteria bacterium CG03_land_8_20_14_0_80_40_19]|uniref:2-oxoacid:ferredoxin oxidoreductase subunit beta n=3 Tax=Candidatus Shapironibacteriota TaxID=1752721 RepID=A0A2M7BCL0_9BACT|nr:MAG: 2-oxoacid:ferredoxin oxidoreductase subunit beta [Candidatus Shapirobacteria bacterium CG03_land_8_20_14_0_80_40_19]PJC77027.1 MAG: 2-oxoacid:ferredoxin oxidoreductase subunit beta [Candidatus Shapirobacteria bacterium CG_4_8_14_3_um_filter_39_11]
MNYDTNQEITWCPGCAGYGFLTALKNALTKANVEPKDAVVVYDIGCSANAINFLNTSGVASLHGRSIPFAVGVKMANPNLTVIAQGGEGGIVTEGANHLIHAAQRNDDITVIINNNFVFALTTGQASSATPKGFKTRSTPEGNPHEPLSAVDLALVSGASFVARTFAFDIEKTSEIIYQAITHKGFSLVEIIQPCVVWTKDLVKQEGVWMKKPLEIKLDIIGKSNLWGVLFKS